MVSQDDEGVLIKNRNQNLNKVRDLLPNAEDIVEILKKKETLTPEEAEDLMKVVQAKVDVAAKKKILVTNKRSDVAIRSQKNIQDKTRNVEKMKEEFTRNRDEIERLKERQNQLSLDMKGANIELMMIKKREADRKAKELEDMAKEQDRVGEKALEGGVILISEIRLKDPNSTNHVDGNSVTDTVEKAEVVAMLQPPPQQYAPLYDRVIPSHLPEQAPPELEANAEEFLCYAYWRWSFIELVKVILAILDKMNDAIIEFEGTPGKAAVGNQPAVEGTGKRASKYQHGSFLDVAQLQKARLKATQKGRINYHGSRKLVGIVKTLAGLYLDNKTVSEDEEIKDDDTAAQRADKIQANIDRECKRYLKTLAATFNEACREVTGQDAATPWACQDDLMREQEKRFLDLAAKIAAKKSETSGKMMGEDAGRQYLEVKVTTFVYSSASNIAVEIPDETGDREIVEDGHIHEERQIRFV